MIGLTDQYPLPHILAPFLESSKNTRQRKSRNVFELIQIIENKSK